MFHNFNAGTDLGIANFQVVLFMDFTAGFVYTLGQSSKLPGHTEVTENFT
jgi:hypothetical protein